MKIFAVALAFFTCLVTTSRAADKDKEPDLNRTAVGIFTVDVPEKPLVMAGVRNFRWPTKHAALIVGIMHSSPAERAGLVVSDIIFQVGDTKVQSAADAIEAFAALSPGDSVRVIYKTAVEGGGKVRWKRKAAKVTLVRYWDVLEAQFTSGNDELTGATTFLHRDDPAGASPSHVSARCIVIDRQIVPILRIMYRNDEWLFVDSYSFLIDDKRYEISPKHSDFTRDNTATKCWEWTSLAAMPDNPKDEVWPVLDALRHCKQATVYYHGSQFRDEHELSQDEINRIAMTLEYYRGKKYRLAGNR